MYIPKSLILGLLFAGVGCALGWMLHGSANDAAYAATPAQTALQSVPASASFPAPPPTQAPARSAVSAGPITYTAGAATTATPVNAPTVAVSPAPPENVAHMVTTHGSNLAAVVGRGSLVMGTNDASVAPGGSRTPPSATDLFGNPQAVQPFAGNFPPILLEKLFTPLPGATTRGTAIAGWEDHDVNLVGTDIQSTYDDTNIFRNHNGKINGNTGDTDSSGLNVVDATDSLIHGGTSADEPPWVSAAAARKAEAAANADPESDGDANTPDPGANGGAASPAATTPTPAVVPAPVIDTSSSGSGGVTITSTDFPWKSWLSTAATGVGTSLSFDDGDAAASGSDATVIGADGYADDAVRVVGSHILTAVDDNNVVMAGTGTVNGQIGDSDTGGNVIMGVTRSTIRGGPSF